MNKSQIILIILGVGLMCLMYLGGKRIEDREETNDTVVTDVLNVETSFDFEAYESELINEVSEVYIGEAISIQNEVRGANTDSTKYKALIKQSMFWDKQKQPVVAAYLRLQAGKVLSNIPLRVRAADELKPLQRTVEDVEWKSHLVSEMLEAYEAGIETNPDNIALIVQTATLYTEETKQPMQGIKMLLDADEQFPNNVRVNLTLGQMSIQSGQFDKAVARFKKVLEIESENAEAFYFLAEAYRLNGDMKEARIWVEKTKKAVDNPDLHKELDRIFNN